MDAALHCNTLVCRALLQDRAVVTTCCHVFCLPCADKLEIASGKKGQRKCPACDIDLNNPDDAVVAQLNPGEGYKTSVLGGLSPSIIMECAGRGLMFWNYQMSQEILYQEYLARSLTDKYTSLSAHLDNIIAEANQEIKRLQGKLDVARDEYHKLDGKHRVLQANHHERGKAYLQMQSLYQKLKHQQVTAGMEFAAEHQASEYILHGMNSGNEAQQPSCPGPRGTAVFLPSRDRASANSRPERAGWNVYSHASHSPRPTDAMPAAVRTRLQAHPHQRNPYGAEARSIDPGTGKAYGVLHTHSPSAHNARPPLGFDLSKPSNHVPGLGIRAGVKVGSPRLTQTLV